MKKLALAVFSFLFLFSCSKETITTQDEELVTAPLNVSDIIFYLNIILQKKETPSYVSLRYWKEELLNVDDDISLVVNGVEAKLIKQTKHQPFTGSDALFEIPALSVTGEIKAIYKIKTLNKVYTGEKTLRYVDDYSIKTVWENLEKDYLSKNTHRVFIEKDGTIQISGATVTPEPLNLSIGFYGKIRSTALTFENPTLIAGLNGSYVARYDSNRILSTIEISFGDENLDQSFNKVATLADIAAVYGTSTTNNLGKKVYSSGAFDIEVTVDGPKPTATIRKVRGVVQ